MFKRIDHIEFVPTDFEKTLKFYTEILGFEIQTRRKVDRPPVEELAFIKLGDTLIELFSVKNPAPAPKEPWRVGYRRIALQAEDLSQTLKSLKRQGVEIVGSPAATENLRRAEIRDPDGFSIELTQRD